MNDIIINILRNGSKSGTMRFNFSNAFQAWGVQMFKRFLKIVKESDSMTGTNALEEVAAILFKWVFDWFKIELVELYTAEPTAYEAAKACNFKELRKYVTPKSFVDDIEKALKFLDIASPQKFLEFAEWKRCFENWIERPHKAKKEGESTMKNNDVWYHRPEEATADCIAWDSYEAPAEIEEATEEEAQKPETLPAGCMAIETRHAGTPYTAEPEPAAEPKEEPAEPKAYKAEELHKIMNTSADHVKYTGRTVKKYNEEGYYISYGARFVEGALYKVPESCMKSRAAEIVFRVDRNTGKSLTVTAWEKYNNEITETTHKNKKLNPGDKYFWLHTDPQTGKTVNIYNVPDAEREKYIDFTYWECIDIDKLSRWTSGTLAVIDAEPITEADFEAFKNAKPAEEAPKASGITVTTRTKDYDYTPKYYTVSERLARLHKEMISFDDYKEGSQTAEYKQEVDSVYNLARNSGDPEKSLYLADVFAKRLARWFDDMNRNGASCPSVMIAGPANFPVRKKERQNARHDTLMHQYNKIMNLKNKIAHPHGVEIIRDEIGNEFENVLYFTAVINNEENRLQLIFDEKPEENVRTILKKNGFRWSGRFKAWQRQLTENAICAAWCVVDALDKIEEEEAENAAKIGA